MRPYADAQRPGLRGDDPGARARLRAQPGKGPGRPRDGQPQPAQAARALSKSKAKTVFTPAGRALAWLIGLLTLAALGWFLWSLPGWMEGWRLTRSSGIVVFLAVGFVLLIVIPIGGVFAWAAL